MSTSQTIEFSCPNCHLGLNVDISQAGISGPCPECETMISAPMTSTPIPREIEETPEPEMEWEELEDLPVLEPQILPPHPVPTHEEPTDLPKKEVAVSELRKEILVGPDITGGTPRRIWPAFLAALLVFGAATYGVLKFIEKPVHGPSALKPLPSKKVIPQKLEIKKIEVAPPDQPPEKKPLLIKVDAKVRERLKRFLSAETLDSRRAYFGNTRRNENELRRSAAIGGLPKSRLIGPEKIPGSEASYFSVEFDETSTKPKRTLLIQLDGVPAKINIDAFLDLYDAPIIAFNSIPQIGTLTFNSIVEVSAYCFDDIPNSKTMGKISFYENLLKEGESHASAYLPLASAMFQALKERAVGSRLPCTLELRWNRETDPAKPFLEVVRLEALEWQQVK